MQRCATVQLLFQIAKFTLTSDQTLILVLILKMLRWLKKKQKGDPIIIAAGSEEVEPLKKKKPIAEHV